MRGKNRLLSSGITTGLLVVLAGACGSGTRPARGSEAAAVGPDTQRIERFRRQVEAYRDRLKIPGLSAAIVEDGRLSWAGGFGYADLERRIPATADTLYHIASLTKTFTAILVLQLVEQGKLDLDEPIAHYSKDFKDDAVRIRHLLSHTSEGTPGEHYNYNPDRFEYLKAVLETKTGKSIRTLFVETFLDPLAMRDSVPGPDVVKDAAKWAVLGQDNLERYRRTLPRLAKPYTYYGDGEILRATYPPEDFWVSAGLLSTVRDLAKYDAAVDRHALLKPDTLAAAWTPFVSNAGKPLAHGLGWFVTDYQGTRLVWHFGHWGTGYSALYLKVPARRLTLFLLANSEALADHQFQIGEDITNNAFACAFLQSLVPEVAAGDCATRSRAALAKWIEHRRATGRTAIKLDRALLEAYAGRYQFPHRVLTVTSEGDRLFADISPDGRSELFAETPTQFFLKIRPTWQLTFVKEGSQVIRLDVTDAGQTLSATRIK
jgi:CubicO group peptidase (beta-lactamase class C family)